MVLLANCMTCGTKLPPDVSTWPVNDAPERFDELAGGAQRLSINAHYGRMKEADIEQLITFGSRHSSSTTYPGIVSRFKVNLVGVKGGKFPAPYNLTERTTAWRVEGIRALLGSVGGRHE